MTRRRPSKMKIPTSLAALALAAACHGSTAPSTTPAATATTAKAPTPFDALNLGFEQADTPLGWKVARSEYAVSIDDHEAFEGGHSLQLVHDGIHESGTVRLTLPVEAVRGKILHARAQARTEGVDRGAVYLRLSARAGDDSLGQGETPEPARIRGDHDWGPLAAEMTVPVEAEAVTLALSHAGSGTAWFDGIELEITEPEVLPTAASLSGQVLDPEGAPAPGAMLAVFSQTGQQETIETDSEGRFSLELSPSAYEVGVSGPGGVANIKGVELAAGDNEPLEITLAAGAQRLRGTVHDGQGRPFAGVLAVVVTQDERIYPTRTDAKGQWSIMVPAAEQYMALFEASTGQRVMTPIEDPQADIAATLHRDGAAPAAAIEWIERNHVPLRTVVAGQGLDDMAALDPMFAEATVVGLGEATHGTREFFQLKHRMLEYLVERHGFTVFGLEANRTECRAIEHYVQTGEGDPQEALAGIYFWTWNTQEVLELVEWMRQYNVTHDNALHFVGFDAQTPNVAARNVDAFLARVDAQAPQREAVARFGQPWNTQSYQELAPAERKQVGEALAHLATRFDDNQAQWTAATSADAFADAREDLEVVQQVLRGRDADMSESFAVRDRAMADNVLHIEQRYGKGTKAVLWAHNGHIARSWSATDVMGKYIGDALGQRYVSVGFAFDRGGFQALAMNGDQFQGLREHVIGSAGDGDFEAALREGGPELFALPLRRVPRKGKAATWLRSPLPMRQIGAAFFADDMSCRVVEPVTERFDVVMFVEETTRARPLHGD